MSIPGGNSSGSARRVTAPAAIQFSTTAIISAGAFFSEVGISPDFMRCKSNRCATRSALSLDPGRWAAIQTLHAHICRNEHTPSFLVGRPSRRRFFLTKAPTNDDHRVQFGKAGRIADCYSRSEKVNFFPL